MFFVSVLLKILPFSLPYKIKSLQILPFTKKFSLTLLQLLPFFPSALHHSHSKTVCYYFFIKPASTSLTEIFYHPTLLSLRKFLLTFNCG